MPGCAHCGKELTLADRAAWMCGRIMGDEYCETVFLCPACGEHTLTVDRDVFLGEEKRGAGSRLSRQRAAEILKLMRGCDRPWDGRCHCKSHMKYFDGKID
jgi:predicted RNA-binding Zn-ribbon protein involved in translation (DUF1610 family)